MNLDELRPDCGRCIALCCVALYFSAADGFPADKEAGKPCPHLQPDFRCAVHRTLHTCGLKGCAAYDCLGAGQNVAQLTFGGRDWRRVPETAPQMFAAFLVMRRLHEMLWYLTKPSLCRRRSPARRTGQNDSSPPAARQEKISCRRR